MRRAKTNKTANIGRWLVLGLCLGACQIRIDSGALPAAAPAPPPPIPPVALGQRSPAPPAPPSPPSRPRGPQPQQPPTPTGRRQIPPYIAHVPGVLGEDVVVPSYEPGSPIAFAQPDM